jgi:hypothetical protein
MITGIIIIIIIIINNVEAKREKTYEMYIQY